MTRSLRRAATDTPRSATACGADYPPSPPSTVPRRSRTAIVAGSLGTLLATVLILGTWHRHPYPAAVWLPYQLAGLSFLVSGSVLWWLRPGNIAGRLMALTGATWHLGNLQLLHNDLLFAVGYCLFYSYATFLAHMLLAIPTGRLVNTTARVTVVLMYVLAPLTQTARYFDEPTKEPQIWGDPTLSTSVWADIGSLCALLLACSVIALVVHRFRSTSRPERRLYLGVWVTLVLTGIATAVLAMACLADVQPPLRHYIVSVVSSGLLLTPVSLASGMLRVHLSRVRVADLVVSLEKGSDHVSLRDALAEALEDPTLEVLYWMEEDRRYVDGEGHAVTPDTSTPDKITVVESRGRRLAALVHDPVLADQVQLVRPVVAAASLALENAQLEATAQAQIAEIQASRARLLAAADAERRRIQRDLHDGAQHRLLAISMLLERVTELGRTFEPVMSVHGEGVDAGTPRTGDHRTTTGRHVSRGTGPSRPSTGGQAVRQTPGPATALLTTARKQLSEAVRELRELTEGIHPPALTEQGLAAAIDILAERSPLPVDTDVPEGRWSPEIERAVYYVTAEALTNVYRHAQATWAEVRVRQEQGVLHLTVADNGRGNARPRAGGGIQGLQDRAQAVNGSLRLSERPEGGTIVHLEVPCAQ